MIPFLDLFEVTLIFVEFAPHVLAATLVCGAMAKGWKRWLSFSVVPLFLTGLVTSTVVGSWKEAHQRGFDLSRPSLRQAVEDYMQTGKPDLEEIMQFKTYPEVFGYFELRNLMLDLFRQALVHSSNENEFQVSSSFTGVDWFDHALGKGRSRVYSSGIYEDNRSSLEDAQINKLEHIAQSIGLKKGDRLLDIGCGWGILIEYMATKYGANATGITLSSDQKAYAENFVLTDKGRARVVLDDFMLWDVPPGSFDKVTTVEMFEHVGIRYYTSGLKHIHRLLKDDGVLYFQVSGLRPSWQWRDLVWGMFMNEYVFPGADASTPLYWVTNHLERAGFEVQRVHNMGTHYSRTLDDWLKLWRNGKPAIVSKYGIVAWRRWEVFLRWSVAAALEGSSTVMMIVATKQGSTPTRVVVQDRVKPKPIEMASPGESS